MSATLTVYGRNQLLAAVFNADTYVGPTGLWVALTNTVPSKNDDGTTITEPDPVATGYQRIPIGIGSTFWQLTGLGEVTQLVNGAHPAFTADAGLASGYAVVDVALIGHGNLYIVGELPEPTELAASISLAVGGITAGIYD